MFILEELLGSSLSLQKFEEDYLFKRPYSAPAQANRFRKLISWDLLAEIFAIGYSDCWLPKEGKLPPAPIVSSGKLSLEEALKGFSEGRTVLVRHAEKAHSKLQTIADDFHRLFKDPIDIQLYCTPPGEEGFDWHYDVEEVFVIQSSGEKEFRLRKNKENPPPIQTVLPKSIHFDEVCEGPEIRCLLKAGDWLYIPAGYWHKARALAPSFHLSVGVMALSGHRYLEALLADLSKMVSGKRRFPFRGGSQSNAESIKAALQDLQASVDELLGDEKRLMSFVSR